MSRDQPVDVAVLLATYNGAKYVEQQIASLANNASQFTVHWLDDHSSDNTREIVRAASRKSCIGLREWHQPEHQGIPAAFFELLECVDADIYLFCDQDDIWQPGKIDATVDYLSSNMRAPILCFSDSILFYEDGSKSYRRLSRSLGTRSVAKALERLPTFLAFSPFHAAGHTQGFTRTLRDIYVTHRDLARKYAFMHDLWMHDIAIAVGSVRMLMESPTALWRQHRASFCGALFESVPPTLEAQWQRVQFFRRVISRHLQGFVLASKTLPSGVHLERLRGLAELVAQIAQRQNPLELLRLAHRGGSLPRWSDTAWLFLVCLCSDADLLKLEKASGSN